VAQKTKPLRLDHFDTGARYDVYFEAAQRLVTLRNVRIVGLKTWEEFEDPDDATDTFIAVQNSDDKTIFVEASAVTMVAESGTQVALDSVL